MIARILSLSVRGRWFVAFLVLIIVGIGASALSFLITTYFSSILSWSAKSGP